MNSITIEKDFHPVKGISSVNVPRFSPKENNQEPPRSWFQKFLFFAENQQKNFFGWLAFSLFFQGCVIAPLTIFAIVSNGNNFALWIPCISTIGALEMVGLAAMPTKYLIPVLFSGVFINVIVIILSFLV